MPKKSQPSSPSLYSSTDEEMVTLEPVAVNIRPLDEPESSDDQTFDEVLGAGIDLDDPDSPEVVQHRQQRPVVVTTLTDFMISALLFATLYVVAFAALSMMGVSQEVALFALGIQLAGMVLLGFFSFIIVPMVRGWIGGDDDRDAVQ